MEYLGGTPQGNPRGDHWGNHWGTPWGNPTGPTLLGPALENPKEAINPRGLVFVDFRKDFKRNLRRIQPGYPRIPRGIPRMVILRVLPGLPRGYPGRPRRITMPYPGYPGNPGNPGTPGDPPVAPGYSGGLSSGVPPGGYGMVILRGLPGYPRGIPGGSPGGSPGGIPRGYPG